MHDTVPAFRGDLLVEKQEGKGLFEVTDPTSGKKFTLYDFEISIARMLNGRRTVSQVIEAASKIGIPATLESLEKFVRQLQAYGFLSDGTQLAQREAEKSAWQPRAEWSPELREMFRGALSQFRQNRFAEARDYLTAMLAIDKDNAEAKEALAEVDAREKSNAASPPTFKQVHGPIDPDAPLPIEGAAESDAAPPPSTAQRITSELVEKARHVKVPAALQRVPPWVLAAAGGVVLLLVLLVPFPRTLKANVVLMASGGTPVPAPRDLLVAEAATEDGKWVDAGAALVKLDPADDQQRLRRLEAEVAQFEKQVAEIEKSVVKKKVAKAEAALKKAERDVASAQAALDRASDKKKPAAQKKLDQKQRALDDAKKQLADATRQVQLDAAKQQLAQAQASRDKAKAEVAETALPAPRGGIVADLKVKPGQRISAGEPVAKIVDPAQLTVLASVDPSDAKSLAPGQTVKTSLKGHGLQVAIERIDGPRATAKLENPDRVFAPGDSGAGTVKVDSRSLLMRLLR